MDELQAMLSSGFGKRRGPQQQQQQQQGRAGGTAAAAAPGPSRIGPLPPPQHAAAGKKHDSDDDDDDDEDEDDEERPPPRGTKRALPAADDEDDEIGPPLPPSASAGNDGEAAEDSLPISHEAHLRDHSKSVTALTVDIPGARVATGSSDYDVKLWDFGGMSSTFRPFKTFEPAGPYLLNDLAFSPSGQSILVISATAQAKVYDREGKDQLAITKKGDVYLRDMRHTAGHVAEITCGAWHPNEPSTFLTASADSSVRFWDAENLTKHKSIIVVKSKTERGTRTRVSAISFSHDGRTLATACADGAVHLWATNSSFARPNHSVEGAHRHGTSTSSIVWSRDNRHFATRGGMGDDTVKLWDARAFKKPLAVHEDLPSASAQTNVIFSSDEQYLLTGTAGSAPPEEDGGHSSPSRRGSKSGEIVVLSRENLSRVRSFTPSGVTPTTSIIKLLWHPKINQLFASTSTGSVSIFYSPTRSARGALLCVDRHVRSRVEIASSEFTSASQMTIIVPVAEAANRRRAKNTTRPDGTTQLSNLAVANVGDGQRESEAAKRRRLEKLRQQPGGAAYMPERPLVGPGRGGRIGSAATQHVVQSIWKDNSRSEDPREALLKYADKVDNDPKWTGAWKLTQPKPIFRSEYEDDEGATGATGAAGGGGGSSTSNQGGGSGQGQGSK